MKSVNRLYQFIHFIFLFSYSYFLLFYGHFYTPRRKICNETQNTFPGVLYQIALIIQYVSVDQFNYSFTSGIIVTLLVSNNAYAFHNVWTIQNDVCATMYFRYKNKHLETFILFSKKRTSLLRIIQVDRIVIILSYGSVYRCKALLYFK